MINYQQYMFGPLLFRTQVTDQDIKKVKKLCSKNNKDYRYSLAGIIDHEYEINQKEYAKIVSPYLQTFKPVFDSWYNTNLSRLKCNAAWVNYMKSGEANPPHIHLNCQLSSVLYLQVPPGLKKENKSYIGKSNGPGSVSFTYGESRDYTIDEKSFLPVKGDFFVFPYNLKHYVCTFKSKGERISVSANFQIL